VQYAQHFDSAWDETVKDKVFLNGKTAEIGRKVLSQAACLRRDAKPVAGAQDFPHQPVGCIHIVLGDVEARSRISSSA